VQPLDRAAVDVVTGTDDSYHQSLKGDFGETSVQNLIRGYVSYR